MSDLPVESISVRKRSGSIVEFDLSKITNACFKAFKEVYDSTISPEELSDKVVKTTNGVLAGIVSKLKEEGTDTVDIETIQDIVEMSLMVNGENLVARSYIHYRDNRSQLRNKAQIDEDDQKKVIEDNVYLKTQLQTYQFYSKYSRWSDEKNRRETWVEAWDRVFDFFDTDVPGIESVYEKYPGLREELRQAALNMEASTAMRVFQMAGPSLRREHLGAYNCAGVPIDSIFSFVELLYILMQGCGCGFSVEEEFVRHLPGIRRQKKNSKLHQFYVEDSTEGWCDAFKFGLEKWFAGEDVEFHYEFIRPSGSRLKTKGGRASGPDPLKHLLTFTRAKILARQGSRLTPLDCLDICNVEGNIVHVGGVRRAAEICLFDPEESEVAFAKQGAYWVDNVHRGMSNNSEVFEAKPDAIEFLEFWVNLAKSGTGEPGFFNREAAIKNRPKRRKKAKFLTNPCAEILFRPRGLCNLSIPIYRATDTIEDILRKVRIATIFGTFQATLTKFHYVSEEWKKNAEEERLLGVDIMGNMDSPLLCYGAPNREELIRQMYQVAYDTNVEFAGILGIPVAAAITTGKPGGNSGQLFQAPSTILPWHYNQYIRRFRADYKDPLSKLLIDQGVPWAPETGDDKFNPNVIVFDFLSKAPEGAKTRHDLTALQLLENWMVWKKNWAEHSISATIYVKPNEWMEVGHWVYTNWDEITGLSFLPHDGGLYALSPYQDISKEEYERLNSNFPTLDLSKLPYYENQDNTNVAHEIACIGDKCLV